MKIPSDEEIKNSRILINKITEGVNFSTAAVIKNSRFHNTPIITWKDGKILEIDPFSIELEEDKNKPKS